MANGTDAYGRIHDYEFAVMWYSEGRPTTSAEMIEDWYDTYDRAEEEMKQTHDIINRHRTSRFTLGIVRRRKAGPIEQMLNENTVITSV